MMRLRLPLLGTSLCGALALFASISAAQVPAFDRTQPPPVPPAKALTFPHAQTRTLSNGIPVVILEDHHSPVVSVVAVTDISPVLEPAGKTGLSGMVSSMLREGTTTHTADQLADAFAALGNRVSPFGFYTIAANVDSSLSLMAEQLLHPAFPEPALTRLKANEVTDLREEQENPQYLARRVFADVVYGKTHPYARHQTEAETMSITRADILQFYSDYYCPPNIKFVVAGDVTPDQAVAKLNRVFGTWASGKSGQVAVPAPQGVSATTIYLYDRPQSPQSVLIVGAVGPRRDTPDYYAIELMNTTLGGAFNSRLNLNLREQHQYTYGASSGFQYRRVPEPGAFFAASAVATPKTDSALIQTMLEIRGIRTDRPITPAEFLFAQKFTTAGLALQFETIRQRAGAVAGLVSDQLPLDYYNTVVPRFESVTQSQAEAAAQHYIDPAKLAIVIVGDRASIESKLQAAHIAPVVVVDKL
ncbi:MAG TPA: pitrilysin family protein [Gemmatimonadaceae bacterium]|jgi:zinc protease|nr:pitrilysin family protein [Gemmatimonadaceae bacterium]